MRKDDKQRSSSGPPVTGTNMTWVLPKRASTPQNFAGSKVMWMKSNSKTTKKVSAVIPRQTVRKDSREIEVRRKKHVDRLPPPTLDGRQDSEGTDDAYYMGPTAISHMHREEAPAFDENNHNMVGMNREESPSEGDTGIVDPDLEYESESRRENHPLSFGQSLPLPRDHQKPLIVQKRETFVENSQEGGGMQVSLTNNTLPSTPVPSHGTNYAYRTEQSVGARPVAAATAAATTGGCFGFNDFWSHCFSKPEVCAHCNHPFSFMETTANEYTFRRACKLKANFHPTCKLERAILKKQKAEILRQILKLSCLREQQQEMQNLQEAGTSTVMPARERSWKADIERSRSKSPGKQPTARERGEDDKRTRSFSCMTSRRKRKEERSRSPMKQRYFTATSSNNKADDAATYYKQSKKEESRRSRFRSESPSRLRVIADAAKNPTFNASTMGRVTAMGLVQSEKEAVLLTSGTSTKKPIAATPDEMFTSRAQVVHDPSGQQAAAPPGGGASSSKLEDRNLTRFRRGGIRLSRKNSSSKGKEDRMDKEVVTRHFSDRRRKR